MAKSIIKAVKSKPLTAHPFYKKYPLQLIVLLFPLLLYTNSLFNGYNIDDELVTRNHRLTSKGISAIPEIFSSPYYQDESGYAYEYRPVPLSVFAIEHSLFGDKPFISHFFNLIFYCLLCLCLFRLMVNVGGDITPLVGLTITLLFCAHPSHTEIVCSIKNRDEILGLLFCVLSTHTALNAARKTNWLLGAASAILFLLAMLCKETFIPFAFFIPFAIILFTESKLPFIIILTGLLSIAAYAILDVNPARFKIWLTLLLMAGIPAIYFALKGIPFSAIRSRMKFEPQPESDPENLFSGFKAWYSQLDITSFYSLLLPVIILIIYQTSCRQSWLSLLLIGFLLLGTLYLHFIKYKYWNITLGLLLATTILGIEIIGIQSSSPHIMVYTFRLPINKHVILIEIFPMLLGVLFFWGRPVVRLPALFLAAVSAFYFGDSKLAGDIIAAFVVFSFSRMTYGRFLLLAGFVITAGALAQSIYSAFQLSQNSVIDYSNARGLILISLILFRGNILIYLVKKINLILGLLSILLVFLLFPSEYLIQNPYGKIENIINNDKDYLNVTEAVVKTPTDRPLQYVEFPIAPSASKDLKLGTSLLVMGHYLLKLAVPYPLSFYYGYAFIKPTSFRTTVPIVILILHLLLLLCALMMIRTNRYLAFGIIIYLFSALIISGYLIPIPGIVADRYLSIPSLGWSMAVAIALCRFWPVNDVSKYSDGGNIQLAQLPRGFIYSLTAILCFYTLVSFSRNFNWKDDLTLFRHDIQYVSKSAQAHNLLAVQLMKQSLDTKDPVIQQQIQNEALGHFRSALAIYPDFYNVAFELGTTYRNLNIPDSAIIYFKRAISIDSINCDAHLYVAKLLAQNNRQREAIPYYEYRIKCVPEDYEPYGTLSYIYYTLKEYEKSIAVNTKAMHQFPVLPDPVINIGRTFMAMDRNDSARAYLQKSLMMKPNHPDAMVLLNQLDSK